MNYSFFDELRKMTGKNPIEFYRTHLRSTQVPDEIDNYDLAVKRVERNLRLLDFCVDKGAWSSPKPPGVGRGICVADSDYYAGFGSSTKAAIVDVILDENGFPKVERVFIAIDAGTVINPDVVHAQLEGGVAFALTTALYSEITIENGGVRQSNFHDYPILKMEQMPPVEIAIIPSSGNPKSVGEDSVPITIAALVNAIEDAGGPRIRRLPVSSVLNAS
jgi:isoquinoline 1-oxidoreductase beta subunit